MDTGTHLVIGLGLAGLAYIDPIVAADPSVATAVLIGTVAGQQAPDSDGIMRLKGSAAYIKNHRGLSHSLPAVLIWTVLITMILNAAFPGLPWLNVGFWVFISVALHVFSDVFNAYGTQALRPFSKKWISWNIIHIFDPFIFTTHVIAILIWAVNLAPPAIIFISLYSLLILYYLVRSLQHYKARHRLPSIDPTYVEGEEFLLIPTVHFRKWNVLKRSLDNSYILGELRSGKLKWVDKTRHCEDHPAVEASKTHPDIQAFLSFTSFVCAEVRQHKWGYEVRWADVRYRHRKNYPFVAVLLLNHDFEFLDSYVGWLSETRVEKRLDLFSSNS